MNSTLELFRSSGHTLANLEGNFVQWHRGRPFYACWMVMVNNSDWEWTLHQAAVRLQPWLVSGYTRQAHVTILPGGFPEPLSIDLVAAGDCARTVDPFRIGLGSLSSFTGSPFFEVYDEDAGLSRLRNALRSVLCDPNSQVADTDFQPHLTVGLYQGRFETRGIASVLENYPRPNLTPVWVRWIYLCAYETNTIKGPLTPILRVALGSGIGSVLGHTAMIRGWFGD